MLVLLFNYSLDISPSLLPFVHPRCVGNNIGLYQHFTHNFFINNFFMSIFFFYFSCFLFTSLYVSVRVCACLDVSVRTSACVRVCAQRPTCMQQYFSPRVISVVYFPSKQHFPARTLNIFQGAFPLHETYLAAPNTSAHLLPCPPTSLPKRDMTVQL